jgi:hypothetical protein
VACKLTSLPADGQTVISQAGRSLPGVSSGTHSASPEQQCDPDDNQRIGRDATPEMKAKSCKPKMQAAPKKPAGGWENACTNPSIQLIASKTLC